MQTSYHNTNNETGAVLDRSQRKALTQEMRILDLFRRQGEMTPDEAHQRLFTMRTPITSTRRAISNLTADGLLEKTTRQRMGMYGKMVHVWRYVRTAGYQVKMF